MKWYKKIQVLCCDSMEEKNTMLDGFDENNITLEVEIEESIFIKHKYNRGHVDGATWVFCAIERIL